MPVGRKDLPVTLFQNGCCEPLKATVHGALGVLAVVCFVYNAVAFAVRHERHLARNAVLYGAIVGVEIAHVTHHRRTAGAAAQPAR